MHFTYFCKTGGGGGGELRFSVLLRPENFLCFQTSDVWFSMVYPDDVNIFGWTPVDRRRFVFSSVFVAY